MFNHKRNLSIKAPAHPIVLPLVVCVGITSLERSGTRAWPCWGSVEGVCVDALLGALSILGPCLDRNRRSIGTKLVSNWYILQGKPTESATEARIHDYGELAAKDYIPGAEVLDLAEEPKGDDDEGIRSEYFIYIYFVYTPVS